MNHSNPFSPNNPPSGSPGVPPPSGVPDNGWASAFQDANEAPPARVWSSIERQLDLDDEDGVLPLIPYATGRSVVFGRWAAGVAAACLLALIGWWSVRINDDESLISSTIASKSKPLSTGQTTVPTMAIKPGVRQNADQSDQYASAEMGTNQVGKTARSASPARAVADQKSAPVVSVNTPRAPGSPVAAEPGDETETVAISVRMAFSQSTRQRLVQSDSRVVVPPVPTDSADVISAAAPAVASATPIVIDEQVALNESSLVVPQPLTIRSAPLHIAGNERIVWFSPEPPVSEKATAAEPKPTRKARPKAWVSAGVVAASFDPSVALRAVSGLAYTNNSPTTALSTGNGPVPALAINSHAGRAIAMQANVGIPLSDHWTVETGVGYLNGQSTVQSPVRASALSTEKIAGANAPTLYTDLVSNGANRSVASSADALSYNNMAAQRYAFVASTSYDRAVGQSVSNNYQFVQVPVQLSYELRPRRKFGLALITGMVSNLFVRNTVADAVTVKAQDGVYRPITVAGTAGMRLRFRPGKQWSASLAGTFQQSLQSITRPEVGIQALPQNMGVCFSVDRHF